MPSIFIQVPAYRDFELPHTIQDAIDKSSKNNNIVFGVHNCKKESDDISLKDIKLDEHVEIRYLESTAPDGIGVLASRYIANELYSGEDFYLQIDSHMRFQDNWDDLAIEDYRWYQALGIANPLITMYPPNYKYLEDGTIEKDTMLIDDPTKISFKEHPLAFSEGLIPSQTATTSPPGCHYTPSTSGGMMFTSGAYALIKPNRKIAFWGEELLAAARAFTHGFDLVTARNPLVWHLYHSGQPLHLARRHHTWEDYPELWKSLDRKSREEVVSIFTNQRISDDALGSVRTLDEFGVFAGLDFNNREILASRP